MSKKAKPQEGQVQSPAEVAAEDAAYCVAVIVKQCGLDRESAAATAGKLSTDQAAKVVALGREGQLVELREHLVACGLAVK